MAEIKKTPSRPTSSGRPAPAGQRKPSGQFQSGRPQGARPTQAPRTASSSSAGGAAFRNGPQRGGPQGGARQVFTNEMIKAPRIAIVDEAGEIVGTFSRDDALRLAGEKGLDLVQMAYNPVEMVCTAKMVDYGKYMYNKQKEEREKKKTQKSKGMKEVKFGYTIGDNDLQLKIKKAQEFLGEGYSVRLAVRLKGRERIYADKVVERLKYVEEALKDHSRSQGVKQESNGYSMILFPKGK